MWSKEITQLQAVTSHELGGTHSNTEFSLSELAQQLSVALLGDRHTPRYCGPYRSEVAIDTHAKEPPRVAGLVHTRPFRPGAPFETSAMVYLNVPASGFGRKSGASFQIRFFMRQSDCGNRNPWGVDAVVLARNSV